MLLYFECLANERIQQAQREGQFDNLEGAGKPLNLDDDSHVPTDLRMAYKILKNAGYLPPEIAAAKEIENTLDLLDSIEDEQERYRQMQKLNYLASQLGTRTNRHLQLDENDEYYRRIVARISLNKDRLKGNS